MKPAAAITSYIDVAQVVLYVFWIFFAGLIYYLTKESKREGFPLVDDGGKSRPLGIIGMPAPKTFRLPGGRSKTVPWDEPIQPLNARTPAPWGAMPIVPLGDPMLDGIGPAAYALREDEPELMPTGEPRIVPLRVANDHWVAEEDPDPRGAPVTAADRKIAGHVVDIWIDRADQMPVWLEAALESDPDRHVMIPINLARVINVANPFDTVFDNLANVFSRPNGRSQLPHSQSGVAVRVNAITAAQFANAPGLANPEQISSREEDRLMAYFASGHLYATPQRAEPLL